MKIGVIGTVGVPARYGGFETLAEQLAHHVDPAEHQLVFYGQRSAYPEIVGNPDFAGHARVFLPLKANGAQSMLHDMLAMAHAALKVRPDVLLVLGYSGAWFLPLVRLLRPGMPIVTNIDGMEWRRDKFGRAAKALLRVLEWFGTRFSHRIIADNAGLVGLVREIHRVEPTLIAYGGDHTVVAPDPWLTLEPGYGLAVARIEPENNCHLILEACHAAQHPMVFVGNWNATDYGRDLKQRYAGSACLTLLDPVYDTAKLAHLRAGAGVYLHGHSVGGTNPSLVEAIFHHDRIVCFDCTFNRHTMLGHGGYFSTPEDLAEVLRQPQAHRLAPDDLARLRRSYVWRNVVAEYLACLAEA